MAQFFGKEIIKPITLSGSTLTLPLGSHLKISGQGYTVTSNISVVTSGLTANVTYFVYAIATGEVVSLVYLTTPPSINPDKKLVGAFYGGNLNPLALINTEGRPTTGWVSNVADGSSNGITGSGGGTLDIGTGGSSYSEYIMRDGADLLQKIKVIIGTSGTTDVTGAYIFRLPSGLTASDGAYTSSGFGDITSIGAASTVGRLTCKLYGGGSITSKADSGLLGAGDGGLYNSANSTSLLIRSAISGWSNTPLKDL